eukprot:5559557-Prymnesium_polylepis.1
MEPIPVGGLRDEADDGRVDENILEFVHVERRLVRHQLVHAHASLVREVAPKRLPRGGASWAEEALPDPQVPDRLPRRLADGERRLSTAKRGVADGHDD